MATQFAVDLVFREKGYDKIKKATEKLKGVDEAAAKAGKSSAQASNGIRLFGRSAAGAAGGVRTLGAAVQAALGPIALVSGAVGALGAAFKTLSDQDFAEAKVRTLGVNSKDLKRNLTDLSRELQGQRSVTELTAAAYDVASAGFNDAASATAVLKAASLGATGGFADLNTVANAATSVLNAYGMSAAEAGALVDQFVQTQNDGKIVVAEYAAEIGKVASVAAGLKVPLAEVNAVIAQATAAGVKSEVAFTGLKTALAQLASGQATERMKELGLDINAATIEADGLIGTFKKIKESGADTGQVLKLLGTEAGPALAPVLNNLERFEQLLNNQKNAAGVAAQAAATAAGTIQGAFTRLSNAVQNLFADQNELGQILRVTLLGAAMFVEGLAAAFKTLLAPVRAFIQILKGVAEGLGLIDEKTDVIAGLTELWFDAVDAAGTFADVVVFTGERVGNTVSELISSVTGWFSGLWSSITGGVQSVATAIPDAFSRAFQAAWQIVQDFWNSLPGWLRGPLEAVGNLAGGVAKAVGGAVQTVAGAIKNEIDYTLQASKGAAGSILGGIPKPQQERERQAPAGGGGGGGKADKAAANLKTAQDLLATLQNQLATKQASNELDSKILKISQDYEATVKRINELKDQSLSQQLKDTALQIRNKEINKAVEESEKKRAEAIGKIMTDLDRKIQLEGATSEEMRRQLEIQFEIEDLQKSGLNLTQQEIQAIKDKNAALDATKAKAAEIKAAQADLQNLYDGIGGTIANGIGSAIDAVASGTEDLGQTLQKLGQQILAQVGKMLIFYALAQAFGALAPGGQGIFGAIAKGFGFTPRAEGGPVEGGKNYLVGENGPEILEMSPDGSGGYVYNNRQTSKAMARYRPGSNSTAAGSAIGGEAADGEGGNDINVSYTVERINERNYVTEEQFRQGMNQAAKRGAQGGYAKTMGNLRNSRSSRARIGL